ncbi:sulfatase [Alteromonas pelagimontana]|uniref:Sulfatase n=1 Tax=Alteromonas pelagimontana TaxID=1858656 RepID=A0A6M4MCZ7_9ALTE|nr:sulfatase [Alteromonas pelagimontana]QJR80718.1 sulfatase [Alteromonas pelagimontana]
MTISFRLLSSIFCAASIACLPYAGAATPPPDQAQAQDAPRPNIVLIMADDLGYGDLSSYGSPTIQTPNLDNMAAEGMRLTSFYAGQAVCTPSRAALLTGRYAIRSNMSQVLMPNSDQGLPQSELTLAEILRGQNYQTAMVGKWHLGDKSPYLPTDHGFDSYYGLLYSNDMIEPWVMPGMAGLKEIPPLMLFRNTTPEKEVKDQSILTTTYTQEAVDSIKKFEKSQPFFLYMAYSMPHLPVAAPEKFNGKSGGGLYGDAVTTVDWSVGQILAALEAKNALDNTIVIFISDNGPWQNLPERMIQNGVERWHVGNAGAFRGSKATTYEGGSRVPAIIRWPNTKLHNEISPEPVYATDLLPTLASVSGATIPSNVTVDGRDLTSFFEGKTTKVQKQDFYYFRGDYVEAVRADKWKLRVSPFNEFSEESAQHDGAVENVELYNLEVDPSERFNVSDRYPERRDALMKKLNQFAKEVGAKTYTAP